MIIFLFIIEPILLWRIIKFNYKFGLGFIIINIFQFILKIIILIYIDDYFPISLFFNNNIGPYFLKHCLLYFIITIFCYIISSLLKLKIINNFEYKSKSIAILLSGLMLFFLDVSIDLLAGILVTMDRGSSTFLEAFYDYVNDGTIL